VRQIRSVVADLVAKGQFDGAAAYVRYQIAALEGTRWYAARGRGVLDEILKKDIEARRRAGGDPARGAELRRGCAGDAAVLAHAAGGPNSTRGTGHARAVRER